VSPNNLANLEPDDWGRQLFNLIRRGLIWAGYLCLAAAFWMVGGKDTFHSVVWLAGIGAALQLVHFVPELSKSTCEGEEVGS
jgi:hypothetical protein